MGNKESSPKPNQKPTTDTKKPEVPNNADKSGANDPQPTNTKATQQTDTKDNKVDDKKEQNKIPVKKPAPPLPKLTQAEALIDRAYGCVIGAAIGDSIGSFCEFRKSRIDEDELDQAMEMPGGGTWGQRVITGQVTDDTELAVSLAYGLMEIIGKSNEITRLKKESENKNDTDNDSKTEITNCIFNLEPIAREYRRWRDSNPFDIGICTRTTLRASPNVISMKENAFDYDSHKKTGNQANGAMMRCMPLCLYGYKLEENENIYNLMREDASLTHANMAVYLSNTCYAIMIKYLLTADIGNEKRNIQAFDEVFEYLEEVEQTAADNSIELKAAELLRYDWLSMFTNDKIRNSGNYDDVELNDLHNATQSEGWVKIAFQRCCYHLLKGSGFKYAMRDVVGEAGDTDTNACIVGGVMGAYWGLQGIPKEYVENIKNCKPVWDEKRDIFQAKWYFDDKIVEKLIESAPTDDVFEIKKDYEK
eukprot:243638_1